MVRKVACPACLEWALHPRRAGPLPNHETVNLEPRPLTQAC